MRSLLIILFHILSNFILIAYTDRIRVVIDNVLQNDFNALISNLISFFALFILMLINNWIILRIVRWAKYCSTFDLRTEFLHHLNRIHLYKLDVYGKNNISNRYEKELNDIVDFYSESLPNIIKNITLFALIGVYVFIQSYIFFIAMLLICGIIYLFSVRKGKKLEELTDECAQLDINRNTIEYDILSSRLELRCFGAFDFIMDKAKIAEEVYREKSYKLVLLHSFFWGFGIVAFTAVNIIILSIGSLLVLDNQITFGSIISLLAILNPIVDSMFSIQGILAVIMGIKPIIKRFNEWQQEEEEKLYTDFGSLNNKCALYEMKNFNYKYKNSDSSEYLFEGIDLDIERGGKYLLIGKSGSGKSTLLKVMTGYDDQYTGILKYKGVELNELGGPFMRKDTIFVGNDVHLLSGSVRDIFNTMHPDISDSKITEYLEKVELPFTLDHFVEKGGSNISGGEKQRLCLALVLAEQRKVLLMDECLSMIPLLQQIHIMKKVFEIPDITCLWSDHRILPDIMDLFKNIILIDDNKILHCGDVNEIKKNTFFNELYVRRENS